ncbi:MAG: hypothetical protein HZA08_09150 [Nitrospirae bacterium]|nr:hypothetical protein [Nitrospirota bacterium]
METIKTTADILSLLKQGIEEISCLNEDTQVLSYVLNLCLSHCRFESGHVIRKIVGDTWVFDDSKSCHLPFDICGYISEEDFTINRELQEYFANEFNIRVTKVVPFKTDNTIIAALLLKDADEKPHPHLNPLPEGEEISLPDTELGRVRVGMGSLSSEDTSHKDCLSIIVNYASSRISIIKSKEEIKKISAYYNEILVKKEMAEKLASLGTIAAGLAHELKNPLVSIKTLVQLLPEKFDDPEFRNHFTNIAIDEVERISNIVSDLLEFAKSSEPKFDPLDMESFVDYMISMLSYQFAKKNITVKKRFVEHFPLIHADRSQLKQVALNIFINAMEAMPEGGEIVVETMRGEDIIDGEKVILKITDTGAGIQEEDKQHLFEPFFTTKDSGTGLGLSICKRIVEQHQGKIHIESVYNKGTSVTIAFPAKFPTAPQIPLITSGEKPHPHLNPLPEGEETNIIPSPLTGEGQGEGELLAHPIDILEPETS